MNIGEAQAFYDLLRGLQTDATLDEKARAGEGAKLLTDKAHKALSAGPRSDVTLPFVSSVMDAVRIAEDEAQHSFELGPRP